MATALPPLAYPGSIFSEDDMNRAVAALDLVMQDFLWQPGENRVREDSLARSLAAKGITLGLVRELMRRLADMGIFTPWSHTKPAGRRWENGFPVILIGDETTHCRVTTKERWHSFLLQHRSSRQNASADVPDEKSNAPLPPPCTLETNAVPSCMKAPTPANLFQKVGDNWTVSFEGKTISLRDKRGLRYLAKLLSRPYHALPANVLLASVAGSRALKPAQGTELLDDKAVRALKMRYSELQSELERAKSDHNPVVQEKLQEEMYALSEHLARGTGLGQRRRKVGDDMDRNRRAVSMAITRVLEDLEEKHPSLGRHLDSSVRSGRTFVYDPKPLVEWTF